MPDNYELSDISVKYKEHDEDRGSGSSGKNSKGGGMFVSTAKGFILAFLAIAIAVGVGLIVHFAGPNRTLECTCSAPEIGGVAAALEDCKKLATGGSMDVCNACPNQPSTATCPPATTAAPPVTTAAVTSAGTTAATSGTTTAAPPVTDVRLPLSTIPLRYTVELQPDMYGSDPKEFTFTGSVKILLECKETTNKITLHSIKLNISRADVSVMEENGVAELSASIEFDLARQFLVVHTNTDLMAGRNYNLDIKHFIGPLVDDLAGLYLSSYMRGTQTIYIATTQMQPTDARKTFPCFDEPAIKAEFDVTLLRKDPMTSISNMPNVSTEDRYLATTFMAPSQARQALPCFDEPGLKAEFDVTLVRKDPKHSISNMPLVVTEPRGDGWIADKFQTTPKMSTYLLAFIISDFEYIENTTKSGVTYRAWSRPEAIDQAPYSLKVGVDILDYFEEYFNVSYPLPKQDMIAIPDFAAGAMENWGLITYRETAMLYQPGVSSEGNKQRVAVVVSHELAHQWFGNLVTPSWWDDLWLNEGFASYVEYMGVDHVERDWRMFEQFVVEDLQSVFNFDGLISSHPVYVPVAHPDEINEIFDRISYAKGASIIRMMRFFLGDNTFRQGLSNYLRQLAYGAAFHDDLWFALGNQSMADGNVITDVKNIMDTWTLQMNFPVVMVTYNQKGQISLKQSRYLIDPNAADPGKFNSSYGYKWDIPFAYTSSSQMRYNVTSKDVYMMRRDSTTDTIKEDSIIPDPAGDNWVLGNPMQYGYYRVNYDQRNWDALINQLKRDHTAIHAVNRAQIINDAWNLAKSGELGMETALRTTEYLDVERDYIPWSAASGELAFVKSMLERHPYYGSFKKFMLNKTTSAFDDLTMNNTGATHLESYMRSVLSSLACDYDNQHCIDEATKLFAEWMRTPTNNPIDPGLKGTVYCTAIANGGIEEWEFALDQYKTANLAAEKARLQSALACSREPWILSTYLEMSIDSSQIRRQDAVSVMVAVSRNIIGRSLAWSFLVSKWDFLLTEHGRKFNLFSRMIISLTENFVTQYEYKQLKAFIDSKDDLGSGARAFAQALEKTRSNINWMTDNAGVIKTWLVEQGY